MNEIDLAWAAGVFEGEGSIRINKWTHQNHTALLATMVNTDEQIIAFFKEHWGGYCAVAAASGRRKAYWRWTIASRQAASFIGLLLPYFKTDKYRNRALLALEYQAQKISGGHANRAPEYLARQRDFYDRMTILNKRGVA